MVCSVGFKDELNDSLFSGDIDEAAVESALDRQESTYRSAVNAAAVDAAVADDIRAKAPTAVSEKEKIEKKEKKQKKKKEKKKAKLDFWGMGLAAGSDATAVSEHYPLSRAARE